MLERAIEKLGTTAGQPVVAPCPPAPPAAGPGELRLHVVARYLERKGEDYALVENAGGNWSALPGEDWVALSPAQAAKLAPPAAPSVGTTWEIDRDVAETLLTRFYPPT